MKKETKIFLRTVKYTSLILFCLIIGFYGMAKSYENIRKIGFGEYRKAIEFEDGKINFFDFQIAVFNK